MSAVAASERSRCFVASADAIEQATQPLFVV
jgi:hypothetical protein